LLYSALGWLAVWAPWRLAGSPSGNPIDGMQIVSLALFPGVGFAVGMLCLRASLWFAAFTMAVFVIEIPLDAIVDPTSHNLLPFELALYAVWSGLALGGAAVGRWARKRGRHDLRRVTRSRSFLESCVATVLYIALGWVVVWIGYPLEPKYVATLPLSVATGFAIGCLFPRASLGFAAFTMTALVAQDLTDGKSHNLWPIELYLDSVFPIFTAGGAVVGRWVRRRGRSEPIRDSARAPRSA
jgi:hypothetical protein